MGYIQDFRTKPQDDPGYVAGAMFGQGIANSFQAKWQNEQMKALLEKYADMIKPAGTNAKVGADQKLPTPAAVAPPKSATQDVGITQRIGGTPATGTADIGTLITQYIAKGYSPEQAQELATNAEQGVNNTFIPTLGGRV